MLGETPPTQYDLNFRCFGVPVRVSPFFWIIGILLGWSISNPGHFIIWMGVFFVSILIHEMGHALMSRRYGFQPWVVLTSFGGVCCRNPYQQPSGHTREREMWISFAGPGIQLIFAALTIIVYGLILTSLAGLPLTEVGYLALFYLNKVLSFGDPGIAEALARGITAVFSQYPMHLVQISHTETMLSASHSWFHYFSVVVYFLLQINIFWAILNLMPILPLDGGHLSMHFCEKINPREGRRRAVFISATVAGCLAAFAAIRLGHLFIAIFFGYFCFQSIQMLMHEQY